MFYRIPARVIFATTCLFIALVAFGLRTQKGFDVAYTLGFPTALLSVLNPDNAVAQMRLGNRHIDGSGAYDLLRAREHYEHALQVNPKLGTVRFELARIAFLERRPEEALRLLAEEEVLNPELDKVYYLRGLVYGYDGRLMEAERAFREFVRRRPSEWAGFVDLAWVLFRAGKYGEMRAVMEQALPHHNNAWVKNAYGVALLNLGEKDQARATLSEALLLAERLTPAQWGNAYAGNDQQFYEEGLRKMRQTILQNLALTEG